MERPCAGGGPRPRPSSRAFARDRRRCSSSSCFARCLSSGQASRFTLCPPPSSPELCAVSARKRCLVKKRGTVGGVSVSSTVESGEPLLTTLRSGDSDFLRCVAVADKRSLRGLQLPSFRGISRWGSDAWRTDERLTVCSRTEQDSRIAALRSPCGDVRSQKHVLLGVARDRVVRAGTKVRGKLCVGSKKHHTDRICRPSPSCPGFHMGASANRSSCGPFHDFARCKGLILILPRGLALQGGKQIGFCTSARSCIGPFILRQAWRCRGAGR